MNRDSILKAKIYYLKVLYSVPIEDLTDDDIDLGFLIVQDPRIQAMLKESAPELQKAALKNASGYYFFRNLRGSLK